MFSLYPLAFPKGMHQVHQVRQVHWQAAGKLKEVLGVQEVLVDQEVPKVQANPIPKVQVQVEERPNSGVDPDLQLEQLQVHQQVEQVHQQAQVEQVEGD